MKAYKFVRVKMAAGVRLFECGDVGLLWDGSRWHEVRRGLWGSRSYANPKLRWRLDEYTLRDGYGLGWAYKRDKDWSLRGWLDSTLSIRGGRESWTDAEINEIAAELERRAGLPVVPHESYMLNVFGRGSERWWRPVAQEVGP